MPAPHSGAPTRGGAHPAQLRVRPELLPPGRLLPGPPTQPGRAGGHDDRLGASGPAGAAAGPTGDPVVVHVLYRAETDNLSDEQVASQIEVLNEDFAGTNDDIKNVPPIFVDRVGNPGLRFALATTDPSGAPTTGITRRKTTTPSFGVDDRMKAESTGGTDPWDTARYLNIWVCRLSGGVLGYAQFPGGPPE